MATVKKGKIDTFAYGVAAGILGAALCRAARAASQPATAAHDDAADAAAAGQSECSQALKQEVTYEAQERQDPGG